jgi:hypothetical protein
LGFYKRFLVENLGYGNLVGHFFGSNGASGVGDLL